MKSKYHNRITEIDGIRFDSAKEAEVYQQLRLLERGGKIRNLKLAISLANERTIDFRKETGGGGIFQTNDSWRESIVDIRLPAKSFPEWETELIGDNFHRIKTQRISTKVPLVPAHLMPSGSLENYYILWEVDAWEIPVAAKDPFLLRRINANTFIVFAAWDLTEVEQIVMRGR